MSVQAPVLPLIAAFTRELYHCSDCSYCADAVWAERGIDHVCPTLAHHDSRPAYSGRGYLAAGRAWLEGRSLEMEVLAERVFTCTTCGNCEALCPIGLHPRGVNEALRGELVAHDVLPEPIARLRAVLALHDNPEGRPRAARSAWAADLEFAGAEAEVLYYPGCAVAHSRPAEARAAVSLMQTAGAAVAVLGVTEPCCGAPQRELGDAPAAAAAARTLGATLTAFSHANLVYSGLECRRALQAIPGLASGTSFGEWCLRAIEAGRLAPRPRAMLPEVAVFDSCQARGTPAAAALRTVLGRLGVSIVNPRAEAYGVCCGAGGGMPAMQPAASRAMAQAKLTALAGTAMLLGADARCLAHLDAARGPGDPAVMTLAEFLLAHFEFGAAS